MDNNGLLVLFSGPSGVGKDTVLDVVLDKNKELQKSISLTTRKKRENEVDGKDYYFVSTEKFEELIDNGDVLEFAQFGKNLYGTPKAPIDKWLSEGKTIILKIEVQGARKIKELYPESVAIFLMPPSLDELEKRLRYRGTETEDDICRRLIIAKEEIKSSVDYDYVVVNDELDSASDNVLSIVKTLGFTYKKMKNYISEVINNV